MSRYPQTENESIALANELITGLRAHPNEFPSPPIHPDTLETMLNAHLNLNDELKSVQTRLNELINNKKTSLQKFNDNIKHNLQYAEHVAPKDKLILIGWGARAERSMLQAPGQVRNLICAMKGDNWVTLEWNTPSEGGKSAIYHVHSRDSQDDNWKLIANSYEKKITVNDLDPGKTLEFRVEASNKQGVGTASNSISVRF